MAERPATKLAYRPDIDGLRAVSVLAVIGYHAFPAVFPGGFFGVDVFFVISGFLISSLIFGQLQRSTFSLGDFYRRRIRRILPALIIVLAACLAFGWYALLPEEYGYLGRQVAAAAAFVSNFALWTETGYFAPATQLKPLLHLWSLGIEEQFYLLWPLLLLLLSRRRLATGWVIALFTGGSFAWDLLLVRHHPTAAFYFPLSRFWELGLGCFMAWLSCGSPGRPPPMRAWGAAVASLLSVAGLSMILVAVFCCNSHSGVPGWPSLLPTLGALCIVAQPGKSGFQRRILAYPPLVFVGLISYPLYLWHWPILSFAAILHSGTPNLLTRWACVVLGFGLAILTYRLIEKPIRAGGHWRPLSPALLGSLVVAGLAGLTVFHAAGFGHRFDRQVAAIRPQAKTDPLCEETVDTHIPFNYCKRTSEQPPDVVFLGDSQTEAVYEGAAAALGKSYSLMMLARGGCPPTLNASVQGLYPSESAQQNCNKTWNEFVEYVQKARPRLVVLVGAGTRFFDANSPKDASAKRAAFKRGMENLLGALQATSRVVYVREIPEFQSSPSCYLRPFRLPGTRCSAFLARGALELHRSAYSTALEEVKDRFPSLVLVDPIPALCNSRYCSEQLQSGEMLYRDEIHLTQAGGRRVAKGTGLLQLIRDTIDYPG
ncbi:MAG TPA: acyltransferase family protein [Steroidobacteraceae bacterium]|nr:acyltransferase family protein [Steroidobacteraceae bacterium]